MIWTKRLINLIVATVLYSTPTMAQNQNVSYGDSILRFDFDGMRIGVAEYEEGPTGTTIFYFPDGVMGAADIRGGATGTVNAHVLTRGYERKMIEGIIFSGGSWYGLSAATGVANGIKELKAEQGDVDFIAGVLGGIIYDVGWRRFSRMTPDDDLGRRALLSAEPDQFPMGARGAGRFAMQGSYYFANEKDSEHQLAYWPHSGQGGAFGQIGDVKIAVFTVVNAVGAIVDRDGRLVRCHRNDDAGECPTINEVRDSVHIIEDMRNNGSDGPTNNTTLTLVVTNLKMPFWALQRLAVQVHTSMGRAIQPFSTQRDGDVLYAVTTAQVDAPDVSPIDLTFAASELAWDAVLNSVPKLPERPQPLDKAPEQSTLKICEGEYEFYGGAKLSVVLETGQLTAEYVGRGTIYFNEGQKYDLIPAKGGLFIVDTPAKDVIRFNMDEGGKVSGLTINPGPWHIEAKKNK